MEANLIALRRAGLTVLRMTIQLIVIWLGLLEIFALAASRQNGKIAFTSNRDGNLEIYIMNPDGSGQTRLTNNPGVDNYPTWSPDGTTIAFVRERTTGEITISLMSADGTFLRDVTPIDFAASPYPWHDKWSMSWSPDGNRIAFEFGGDIYSVNSDGSNRFNITNSPEDADFEPSWSPDGAGILFVSSRDYYLTLHMIKADGTDLQALPTAGENWDTSPSWAPDGSRFAFVVHSETYLPVINIANADGTGRAPFDGDGFGADHRNKPQWSPDGTKLVYHLWNYFSNDAEIAIKNVDGSGFHYVTGTLGSNFNPSWQPIVPMGRGGRNCDFDGDGKTDISIFRPSGASGGAEWWHLRSSDGQAQASQFGSSTDQIVAADFTGDGITDIAVWRPSTGEWFIVRSEDGSYYAFPFGEEGDIPVPADYDGDGKADAAVFRGNSLWLINRSSDGELYYYFLGAPGDQPIPADYDGDGRADVAIFRPSGSAPEAAEWWILRSSNQKVLALQFGSSTDKAVAGDFTGDGKADVAVYRPSKGNWFVLRSEDFSYFAFPFGTAGDVPVPGDYDGDRKTDAAVFRPSTSTWFVNRSSGGTTIQQFATSTDMPVANAYVR